MSNTTIDPLLFEAWVSGRSLARGLPPPVPDRGGLRVDTDSKIEVCRWIFPQITPAIAELAQEVSRPGYLLKACGSVDKLRAAVPSNWQVQPTGYFMATTTSWDSRALPPDYMIEVEQVAAVTQVWIRSSDGELAASGYAAETARAFVYDRIMTAPEHRRKGLGQALMTALRRTCRNPGVPGLLVATEEGSALYWTLGWRSMSLYSTAFIPAN